MSAEGISPDDQWPLPPAWMFDCSECVRVYRDMKRVEEAVAERWRTRDRSESAVDWDPMDSVLSAQIRLSRHLADAHRDLLPDWTPGCDRCADHQKILSGNRCTGSEVAAAEHRASHLYAPPRRTRIF
ncbi:hypothetical protein RKE29_20680 [Streptomyces sp. B1866]|uniref:hypothetical protein n=1 Tax=Streptomyces sp. B1866 TaxID=3075431 RepID=UPI00288CDECE|nr:hypothetical protein [Streptomyces sp. B1866]MDT3399030.1 hypothetical protein [Streptomyces sp. B1866]